MMEKVHSAQCPLSDTGRKQILGKEPMLESSDQSCSKYLPAIISDRHKQRVLKLEFLKQDFVLFYEPKEK